jgi:hypothetical protein
MEKNASNYGQKIITDNILVNSSDDDLNLSMANLKRKIDLATGQKKIDLLVKNAGIVNVFSGEIYKDNVANADGIFVGFGHTEEYNDYDARDVIDAQGRFMILWQPEVGAALISGSGGTVYLPLLVGRARRIGDHSLQR